jgi:hypothetical protein
LKDGVKRERPLLRRLRARFRLLKGRMVREKMPAERIAAGWSIGMFIGCAIPFGFQLVVSVPLAVVTRTSKIGATLGTFITNPVTIFFIYPAQTWAVYRILFGGSPEMPSEWTFEAVRGLAGRTIASFFIGGVALGVVLAPLMYVFVLRAVTAYRRRKAAAEGQPPAQSSTGATAT